MVNQSDETKESRLRNEVREIKKQMLTLLIGGLGLVAALAWNDAVLGLFNRLFPQNEALAYKFGYAILITAIVVFLSIRLRRLLQVKQLHP